ncbi:exosporium leader peptide-containing protein [Bacillus cereus group sp. RP43]
MDEFLSSAALNPGSIGPTLPGSGAKTSKYLKKVFQTWTY